MMDPFTPVDATAIVVTYNEGGRLQELLPILQTEVKRVVVVDNASEDGCTDLAQRDRSIVMILNHVNLGFATAANQGAAVAHSKWLLFVNADAHVEPGQITRLLDRVPEAAAAVAPLQVDASGTPRPDTGGYDPSLIRYTTWAFVPTRFHWRWGPWLAPPFRRSDTPLDWVSGAMLGIRRSAFEEVGGFDERFFLYGEDADLGKRLRGAGYQVLCRPGVRLFHEVAHGDLDRRVRGTILAIRSTALHFTGWRRRALGLLLLCGYGVRRAFGDRDQRIIAGRAIGSCWDVMIGRGDG
jgi:N-acetylglucosaminyl-diphospho-decaprenol L-rhamnosyltransferase